MSTCTFYGNFPLNSIPSIHDLHRSFIALFATMKFLCLHGTATNSDVSWPFHQKVCRPIVNVTPYIRYCGTSSVRGTIFPESCYEADIVAPLIYELGKHQAVEFHFLNGPHEVSRFPGLETYYHGPFFRYYGRDAADVTQVAFSMQSLPTWGSSPENFSRNLRQLCPGDINPELATHHVLDFARNSDLGPFDGLLGFSEGASVVASMLVDCEQSRSLKPFKCAILICGAPPFRPGNEDPYLADEVGKIISTPTLHILGAEDPGRCGGLALYNLCMDGTASLYDHGRSHEIPRVPAITKKMAVLIRDMIVRVEETSQSGQ